MTRKQAIELALVSFWVAWTLFIWFAATRSFRTADKLLRDSETPFNQAISPLGERVRRAVLRHVASQINAVNIHFYGVVQIVLGIIVLALLVSATPRDATSLVLTVAMLVIAIALAEFVEPRIASLGRNLDFNSQPVRSPGFWILHSAYTALDAFKLLAGIALIVRWILMA